MRLQQTVESAPWLCTKSPSGLFCICALLFSQVPSALQTTACEITFAHSHKYSSNYPGRLRGVAFFVRITQVAAKWQGKFCAAAASRIPVAERKLFCPACTVVAGSRLCLLVQTIIYYNCRRAGQFLLRKPNLVI